jgi:hypothetical protein
MAEEPYEWQVRAREARTCPECGAEVQSASALADHALTAHTQAPSPAAHIRPLRHPTALRVIGVVAVVLGVAAYAFAFLAPPSWLSLQESAPETPSSIVHKMAVELEAAGEIDEYRAVEPSSGWDTEYEVDEGDGYIKVRDEDLPTRELEIFHWDDDRQDAMEQDAEQRGFVFD